MQHRRQQAVVFRQTQHVHPGLFIKLRVSIGKNVKLTTACRVFLEVGLELFQQRIVGGDTDHRHVFVNQGQGAMLQFARRIRLGMNVGDFLKL